TARPARASPFPPTTLPWSSTSTSPATPSTPAGPAPRSASAAASDAAAPGSPAPGSRGGGGHLPAGAAPWLVLWQAGPGSGARALEPDAEGVQQVDPENIDPGASEPAAEGVHDLAPLQLEEDDAAKLLRHPHGDVTRLAGPPAGQREGAVGRQRGVQAERPGHLARVRDLEVEGRLHEHHPSAHPAVLHGCLRDAPPPERT